MTMTTVSFNTPLADFDGKPIIEAGVPAILGRVLANKIANAAAERNVVKLYNWSTAMWKGEELKLDSEDVANLKQFVEVGLVDCPVFIKAAAIEAINRGTQQ
jgi:hypothetical protein